MFQANHSTKYKNRKYKTYSNEITVNEITYQVNARKSGLYSTIIKKAIEQLDICLNKWKRVLVIRFDLHQEHWCGNNQPISKFRKNIFRRLERKYEFSEMGYFWVREIEKAKSQHYHFALYLDGNKVRHSKNIHTIATETWKAINQNNHVWVPKRSYYFIDNERTKEEAIYRLSYLAKTRGKGYRDSQAKDYSTSRLTPNREKAFTGITI